MSLVSSLSSTMLWNDRASEMERKYALLTEEINTIMDEAGDIGMDISRMENATNNLSSRESQLTIMLSNEPDPTKREVIQQNLQRVLAMKGDPQRMKAYYEMKKNQLDKQERQLQKEKVEMETVLKFARSTAEGMQKLIDPAIKRLTIQT